MWAVWCWCCFCLAQSWGADMGLNNLTSERAWQIMVDALEYNQASVRSIIDRTLFANGFHPEQLVQELLTSTAQWAIATGILGDADATELRNSGVWQGALSSQQVQNVVERIIAEQQPQQEQQPPPVDTTPNEDPPPPDLSPDPPVQSMKDKRDQIWNQYSADWLQMALEIIRAEEGKTNTQPFNLLYEEMNRKYAGNGILDYLGNDYYLVLNGAKTVYDKENQGDQQPNGAPAGEGELGSGETTVVDGADPGNPEDPTVELDLPAWAQGLETIITQEQLVLADQGSEAMRMQVIAVLVAMSASGDYNEVDSKMYLDRANFLASQWGISWSEIGAGGGTGEEVKEKSNIQKIAEYGLIGWVTQGIFGGLK